MSSIAGPGAGSGFAVKVGNTLMKAPDEKYTPPADVKAYKPVPLHTVSKQPRPKNGPCRVDPGSTPKRPRPSASKVECSSMSRSAPTARWVK